MSFILDALNRSESDRQDHRDVPGLHTVHGGSAPPTTPVWRRLLWPLLAVLFAALAAIGWWSAQRPAEPPPPTPAAAAPTAVKAFDKLPPAAPPPAEPAAAPEPVMRVESAQREDIAALYESAAGTQSVDPAPARSAAPEPAKPAGSASTRVSEPALNVEVLAKAAEAELEDLQARDEPVVEHAAPFIAELRQSQKDQIPSIFYRAHHWSANPAERSVVLNKQTYREGQQVKPGLRLVEILEDSIVLDYQGTEFRLRSLNSWVNL